MMTSDLNFEIPALGRATIPSPITVSYFTPDDRRIIYDNDLRHLSSHPWDLQPPLSIEVAGPRRMIYFDPPKTKAAIVTCGGLCPGINDVIRAIVMELYHRYGIQNIVGIKYGFQGLIPSFGHEVIELSPELVKDVHAVGGSILSSSRGKQDIGEIVNVLKRMNIDIFFCIGGDGTMRATELITEEIARRKLDISVIGIPKTIDNDLNLVDKTFGFDTAISEAVQAIRSAHVEAKGADRKSVV